MSWHARDSIVKWGIDTHWNLVDRRDNDLAEFVQAALLMGVQVGGGRCN